MTARLTEQHWADDGCPTDPAAENALADRICADEHARLGPSWVPFTTRYPHKWRQAPHPHAARFDEARAL